MNSETTFKTLKGNSLQPPMFDVSQSLHQKDSTFKDISSSSCIKPKDPTPNSQENVSIDFTNDDSEISIFDAHKYFSESNDSKDIKGEMSSHYLVSAPKLSSVSSVDGFGRNFRTRTYRATPTASSEASWNSRTVLFANSPGSLGVSIKNLLPDCGNKRWSAVKEWFLGRKCCCRGEKSVQVKEVTSEPEHRGPVVLINTKRGSSSKTNNLCTEIDESCGETTLESLSKKRSTTENIVEIHHIKTMAPNPTSLSPTNFSILDEPRQQRITASGRSFIDGVVGFTFPILNISTNHATKRALKTILAKPTVNPVKKDISSASRPTSVDNPAIPRRPFNPGSTTARDEDVESDASSDLFEIESLSTQTVYRGRDSVDDHPKYNARKIASANEINNISHGSLDDPPTPSECYPHSDEVSIDWSISTAEVYVKGRATNLSASTYPPPPQILETAPP